MIKVGYSFPLADQQSGALLGNGETGVMLWGGERTLNITVGCASLWDHRGGMQWSEKQNFQAIRAALEAADLEQMRKLFNTTLPGDVRRPTLIPVGRVKLTLPENSSLTRYEADLKSGITKVFYTQNDTEKSLLFAGDFTMQDVLACQGITPNMTLEVFDSYTLCETTPHLHKLAEHNTLKEHGLEPPRQYQKGHIQAFIQPMVTDDSYSLICCDHNDGSFTVSFKRALEDFEKLSSMQFNSYAVIAQSSVEYMKNFWQDVPQIKYHVPQLEQHYYHSLFKYAIMTNPAGTVPGLQAAWIEDDRLPPWQGDYHFNINIQMYMLPGLKSGKFSHLKKLFDLVLSWKEQLRLNARYFANIENGYMLPHAVDDRGVCMGGFWSGCIDHGCSAWVAQMMFDYCEYSGDMDFLANEVYDFMLGVQNVYYAMTERDENGQLSLPVTTSPEYRGSRLDAWGRNASFQLAACHQLARNILRAGQMLDRQPDELSLKIRQELPLYTLKDGEIALWQDLLLEESHRHHSHLAGIAPFEIIDPTAPEMQEIMEKTLFRWTRCGMGEWTGWCMPWASQLWSRCGNGDMAELILKIWKDCFTNLGGGSLHDGRFKGFTIYSQIRGEVMQIDGTMGAVTAIFDQFMHVFEGELRLFYGIAEHVRDVSFENMAAPKQLRVSGSIDAQGRISARITAQANAEFKISIRQSEKLSMSLKAGETVNLSVHKGRIVADLA